MRIILIILTLSLMSSGVAAMTHDAESRKNAREREARQEKARKQNEQRMLEAIEKCEHDSRRLHPKNRKERDKYYEACATRAAKGPRKGLTP